MFFLIVIYGVADSRYEPISLGIGTSFKFLQNHTAIQQRLPFFRESALLPGYRL